MDAVWLIPDVSRATCLDGHSNNSSEADDEDDDGFEDEEPFQLVRRSKQDRELNRPKDEL